MEASSVRVGGFDRAALRKILDIPEYVIPMAVVYFDYPAKVKEPRTQYIADGSIVVVTHIPTGRVLGRAVIHKPKQG